MRIHFYYSIIFRLSLTCVYWNKLPIYCILIYVFKSITTILLSLIYYIYDKSISDFLCPFCSWAAICKYLSLSAHETKRPAAACNPPPPKIRQVQSFYRIITSAVSNLIHGCRIPLQMIPTDHALTLTNASRLMRTRSFVHGWGKLKIIIIQTYTSHCCVQWE